ncbi:hypothetical protein LXA43DRAFT_975005 [Ganoderma leucocontextum]|nr:hypothetical protein LXA43DRAFT_975005 [Ganoderma leucocontextum]
MAVRLEKVEKAHLEIRSRTSSTSSIRHISLNIPYARCVLKRALHEAITPTESLLPGEEPGYDCVRAAKDFPNLKFFIDRKWNEWRNKKNQATRIGDERVRGKKKSSQGENHTAQFIERPDGSTADGDYVNSARRFCREFISLTRNAGYPLPSSWGEADLWLQEVFYAALRRKFPLFQLCHNNSKGHALMSGVYYDSFVRKLSKSSKPRKSVGEAVDLDDAQYTIKSADDELPNTFDVDPAAPAKRATDGTPDERPAKPSTTSTSSSSKGKQRATPDLLSLIKPRTMGPTPSPSSAIATSASSSSSVATSVAAPESQSGPSSISMPVLDASLATTHIPESSSTSTLAPRSSPVSTLAPGLAAPSTLAPDLLATSERATNLSTIPAVSPVPSSSSSPSALALTSLGVPVPSTKSAMTEASTAATASAKQPRPRPRRKATAWPPPEDMEGPKWAYARKWYADHHGVEAAFEQHYKGLGTTEKRVRY